MRQIKILLILFITTGCSSIFDGIIGRFSHFDSMEYYLTVEIEIEVSELKSLCGNQPPEIIKQLQKVEKKLIKLRLYALGRPYNTPTVNQIDLLKNNILQSKTDFGTASFSRKFCVNTMKDLEEAAEIIRKSSGDKKL